jgi:hypothetical protein
MKITAIYFVLFVVLTTSCQEKKSKLTPDDIGKKTFEILKNINKTSLEDYNKKIITLVEMKAAASDEKALLGSRLREEFKSMTESHYNEVTLKDYYSIKSDGKIFKIDWDAIKFVNFKHAPQPATDETKILIGETSFTNVDGNIYFVKSAAYFDGEGYKLMKVNDVRPEMEKMIR